MISTASPFEVVEEYEILDEAIEKLYEFYGNVEMR